MGFAAKLGETIKQHVISYAKGLVNTILDRLDPKTIASEVAETATTRIIPHGAAELAHAFMTQGSGYVPYGQEAIPVSETMAEQYQASLAMNAQAGQHDAPDQTQAPSL